MVHLFYEAIASTSHSWDLIMLHSLSTQLLHTTSELWGTNVRWKRFIALVVDIHLTGLWYYIPFSMDQLYENILYVQ